MNDNLAGGLQLTLMIGPAIPIPVPKPVIDALVSVKVMSRAFLASGFELVFALDVYSPLQTLFLLAGGQSLPLVRVVIVATLNGQSEVLIDGVMTEHNMDTNAKNGNATLTIIGEDLTRVMDYLDFGGLPYPAMPAEAQVGLALLKYVVFGVIPMIIPSILIDISLPIDRIPRHKGTDLKHIRRLADQVGYVFYLEPGPVPGTSIAYWGPPIKWGPVQPALAVDADAATNVESLAFKFKNDRRTLPIVIIQEPITKLPIPIPVGNISPLNPPLGLIPPIPLDIDITKGGAKWSAMRAVVIAMAKAAKSADAISASGSLEVQRYGRILKPRHLVGVRGSGTAFDGLYYVESVTHDIKRGEYKQSFELSRNGLISTVSRVSA
jgi:hypothetical protein